MASPSFPAFHDGTLHEVELYDYARTRYPFANNPTPDVTTKVYERMFGIEFRRYTPKIANRTLGVPDKDPVDLNAYLVFESDPESHVGCRARVRRSFAKIPGDQVIPDVRLISRPPLDDTTDGTYFGVSWDPDKRSSYIFAVRKTITAIAAIVNDGTKGVGGTVVGSGNIARSGDVDVVKAAITPDSLPNATVSFSNNTGGTGSFNLTSSESSIESSLAAASITAQVIKTSTSLTIQVLATSTKTIKTMGVSSAVVDLDGSGDSFTFRRKQTTSYDDATDTHATLDTRSDTETHSITETYYPSASVRSFTIAAGHSANPGDMVAFYQGSRIVAKSIVIATPSGTVFAVLRKDVDGADFAAATCVFSSAAIKRIVNGPRACSVRNTQKFYLPGVTPGITTAADIPLVTPELNAEDWLTAVMTKPTGWAVASAERLTSWMGPILVYEYSEVQMADAIQLETP